MLRTFKADLHIHTCLSPCATLEMSARAIVERAITQGIDVIAITDHNSAENVTAVIRAARGTALTVLPGMEATSREEVHLLALFDGIEEALALQDTVYAHLPGENDEQAFGMQVVVNEDGEVLGLNRRLLSGAAELTVEGIVEAIRRLNGAAIASHVDRETFGIIGQLGFIPEGLRLDALELSPNTSVRAARRRFPQCAGFAFIRSSDAHSVDDIGKATTLFLLGEPTVAELKKAFFGCQDRRVVLEEGAAGPAGANSREFSGLSYGGPVSSYIGCG
jgi:PHP family Zn ribbon phosphoesterase